MYNAAVMYGKRFLEDDMDDPDADNCFSCRSYSSNLI